MTDPVLAQNVPGKGRHYFRPGRSDGGVPSITNIMRRHNKPAINSSNVRKAAEWAVQNRERLAGLTEAEQVTLIKEQQYAKSPESVIGDVVHDWIDRYVKGVNPPTHDEVNGASNTAKWMWYSFIKFERHYNPEWTASEFTVWSDKHGYAGTGDLAFYIRPKNGSPPLHVLCDTKTGKRPYSETAMQLAALSHADVVVPVVGAEYPVPKYDRYAILHVRPRGATLVPVLKIEEAWEAFLALKVVFDWELNHADTTLGFAPKIN